jgi:hypothetical protein
LGLLAIVDSACDSFGFGAGWKSVHPCDTFKQQHVGTSLLSAYRRLGCWLSRCLPSTSGDGLSGDGLMPRAVLLIRRLRIRNMRPSVLAPFALFIAVLVSVLPEASRAQSWTEPHLHIYFGFVKPPTDHDTTPQQWRKLVSVMSLIRKGLNCSEQLDAKVYCDDVDQRSDRQIANDWKELSKFGVTHYLIATPDPDQQYEDSTLFHWEIGEISDVAIPDAAQRWPKDPPRKLVFMGQLLNQQQPRANSTMDIMALAHSEYSFDLRISKSQGPRRDAVEVTHLESGRWDPEGNEGQTIVNLVKYAMLVHFPELRVNTPNYVPSYVLSCFNAAEWDKDTPGQFITYLETELFLDGRLQRERSTPGESGLDCTTDSDNANATYELRGSVTSLGRQKQKITMFIRNEGSKRRYGGDPRLMARRPGVDKDDGVLLLDKYSDWRAAFEKQWGSPFEGKSISICTSVPPPPLKSVAAALAQNIHSALKMGGTDTGRQWSCPSP